LEFCLEFWDNTLCISCNCSHKTHIKITWSTTPNMFQHFRQQGVWANKDASGERANKNGAVLTFKTICDHKERTPPEIKSHIFEPRKIALSHPILLSSRIYWLVQQIFLFFLPEPPAWSILKVVGTN